MRDKNNNKRYEADDREAELYTTMQNEQADAALFEKWLTIPDQRPAKRPNSEDEKALAFLKHRNLVPTETQVVELQKMLDDIEGAEAKATRGRLLKELQQLPTTKDVHDSYQWLAYSLTFHEAEQHPSLFNYHQQLVAQ